MNGEDWVVGITLSSLAVFFVIAVAWILYYISSYEMPRRQEACASKNMTLYTQSTGRGSVYFCRDKEGRIYSLD